MSSLKRTRSFLSLPVLMWLTGTFVSVLGQDAPRFTSIAEIRALGSDELAKAHSVKLEAIVVGSSTGGRRAFIQHQGMGLGVITPRGTGALNAGARIEINGKTIHAVAAMVTASELRVIEGKAGLPDAETLSVEEALNRTKPTGRLVQVSGLVQAVRRPVRDPGTLLNQRVQAQLRENNRVLTVIVRGHPSLFGENPQFGEVTVTGLLTDVTRTNAPAMRCLWVLDSEKIVIDRPGVANPFDLPLTDMQHFLAGTAYTNRMPIRIRGRVRETMDAANFSMELDDDAGASVLCRNSPRRMITNEVVEVVGYPLVSDTVIRMDVASVRAMALPAAAEIEPGKRALLTEYESIITEVPVVHDLAEAEVERGVPVKLMGRVSYWNELENIFYLQHYTARGVRVIWRGTNDLPNYNDTVEVFGYVTNGIHFPRVVGRSLVLKGRREDPLPTALVYGGGFMSGRHDGRRVQMNGVVRSVRSGVGEDVAVVRIVRQDESVSARVQLNGAALPTDWVDAQVTVQGVCAARRSLPNVPPKQVFLVQSLADVEVMKPGLEDPFAIPQIAIEAMMEERWDEEFVHRVGVAGQVTHVSRERIFVDDDTGGIEVRARADLPILSGDRVVVVGFPTPGKTVPFLEEAIVRRVSGGELPVPERVAATEILGRDLDGRYVRTQGEVIGHPGASGNSMELRDGGVAFSVIVPEQLSRPVESLWPLGAVIESRGVCQIERSDNGTAERFRILLNGAEAAKVIVPPPWWTAERIGLAAGVLVLGALGAIAWAAYFRKRARQNRQQFLATFHANPMPAWIIRRKDRKCVELNGEFERMFAVKKPEVVGNRLEEMRFWASDDEAQKFIKRITETPSLRAEEAHLRSRDGKDRNVLLSSEPIVADGENCVLLIAYDVTERLRLLEQLRQSQKMEAIGQLAAGVAHDFNNLMTVVRGNAGLLSTDPSLSQDAHMLTDEIEDASRRAAELTSQMLAFSRKSIMRPRVVDLRDVLRTAAGMLNRMIGETIEVSYHCPQEPLLVKADSVMLDQVLLNLGVNARDAMPEGGTLKMTARSVDYDADNLPRQAEAEPGRYVLVEVEDTGTGMSEDVKQHIFDPFFTTKDIGQGTGLGLSTAYGILRQHGGWIAVESQLDQGSKFTLHLPSTVRPPEEANGEVPSADFGHGTETILMVDDEDRVRQTVSRTLKHYGYQVLEAVDGPTAEKLWSEQGDEVDLVLTDLVMPNGCSGLELGRRLQAEQPDLKIIYMTGHSQELLEHGGQLVAGVDFLPKPFENRDLVRLIRERLDGRNTATSAADPAIKPLNKTNRSEHV